VPGSSSHPAHPGCRKAGVGHLDGTEEALAARRTMKGWCRPSISNARAKHPCSEAEKETAPDKLCLIGIIIAESRSAITPSSSTINIDFEGPLKVRVEGDIFKILSFGSNSFK